jgi:co-chaperonin GroES (HSP10)
MSETVLVTNNYVLIKLIKPKNEKASGLYMPDKAMDLPQWGWVLDVGEGLSDNYGNAYKPYLEPGELVYFMKHAPEKIDYSDKGLPEDLYVIGEGDVYIKMAASSDETIIPLGNYVNVEPMEESVQKVSPGGIVLPDQVIERPTKGIVKSVGPGQRTIGGKYYSPRVSPGDIVRYRPHSTFTIKFEGAGINKKDTYLVAYGDIVAIEKDGFVEKIRDRWEVLEGKVKEEHEMPGEKS